MSFKVAVCYGQPDDPEAFDAYYRDTHMPLARKVPGLTDFTWGKCSALDGGMPPYYAVASLVFPDAATMKSGLQSEEMKQAGKDVRNFATGGVTMYVQEEESVYNQ
ncbi:EthD family reductase [Rhodococcus sp. IEGM 248]|uniref:EthD family reductase n=1 Tax=Rhodococcus opacus TaxID=37919 RepID=UPI0013BF6914|nr:EthD family reductase [Rhodococcus opacus]MDV7085897.1 EthD family reductase [Rhodococcus opacus]NDV09152.1 EthD family reductase [Rhodococcus sp. IEGM 248]